MDVATVFIGWAAGCLAWQAAVGTRRTVSFGAAWVIRVFAIILAALALASAVIGGGVVGRDVPTVVFLIITVVALAVSIIQHRTFRAPLTGTIAETGDSESVVAARLDVLAAIVGLVAMGFGVYAAGGPAALAFARAFIGATVLGGLNFAMVFGHRMLAKPYLGRAALEAATAALLVVWPLEVIVMLIPTGMVSVLNGTIDDGYMGILGWMWATCAVFTFGLLIVARVILADRAKSVLASATGMLYLATLTGFGAVWISRAVLSG